MKKMPTLKMDGRNAETRWVSTVAGADCSEYPFQ
jgi:hypothetical protein